jgi:hypothetical protein
MIFRKARRKFNMDATRLSVRPHVSWKLRWGLRLPFLLLAAALAWWAYESGLQVAGFHRGKSDQELTALREKVMSLGAENTALGIKLVEFEQQTQIDRASIQETSQQLKNLTAENTRLEDDLSFFQNLTASNGKEGELGLHRAKLEQDAMPGDYHITMLLVQSGQRAKPFVGALQLVASIVQNGQKSMLIFPQAGAPSADFALDFKYYYRIERALHIPADAKLEAVQIRIIERGVSEPKIRQNIELS